MGLLDDAIREHLDLKRRNGADPADLERAEREALGPVRREPEAIPQESVFDEPGTEHEVAPAYDLESHEPSFDQATQAWPPPSDADYEDDEFHPHDHAEVDAAAEPEPPHRRSRFSRIFGRSEDEEEDQQEYLEDEAEPAHPHAGYQDAGAETAEHQLGDHEELEHHEPEPEQQQPDEDVLEETPEFLQDTPDHDRLWFEQRPPRDFDFDG